MVAVSSFGLGRQSVAESESQNITENKAALIKNNISQTASNLAPTPIKNTFEEEAEVDTDVVDGEWSPQNPAPNTILRLALEQKPSNPKISSLSPQEKKQKLQAIHQPLIVKDFSSMDFFGISIIFTMG